MPEIARQVDSRHAAAPELALDDVATGERLLKLLDRVEQLEKRVTELESKSNAKAPASAEGTAAQAVAAGPARTAEAAVGPAPAGTASNAAPPAASATKTGSAISIAAANSPVAVSTKQEQTGRAWNFPDRG